MSKWIGCPVVACKNDLCHTECRVLKQQKEPKRRSGLAGKMKTIEATQLWKWGRVITCSMHDIVG